MSEPTPKIALSMIVRNAAETLRACIESVRGVVDEIVIADTGSTDNTPAIARDCGARVIEFPWGNDFAAARNRSLAEVKADWALILDADEILDPAAVRAIPSLLAGTNAAGYQVPIRNYVLSLDDRIWDRPAKPNDFLLPAAHMFPAYVDHENVRLFRRDPRIYFVGRVHESVGSRIEECGLRLAHAPFLIHHFGLAADADTRARKNILYRDLGRLKAIEMPDSAQAHLELGLVELDNFGNLEEALACFKRSCELNPRLGVAWFFSGIAHFRLGQNRECLACLKQAENYGRATSAVMETMGDAHYNMAEFPEALQEYERALRLSPVSAALESKLGLATIRIGQSEKGLDMIRIAVLRQPRIGESHDRLILSLVWLDRVPEAALAAEGKLRSVTTLGPGDFARSASLWAKLGNWARATAVLHVGLKVFNDDAGLKQALHQLAIHSGARVGDLVETLNHHVLMTSGR
jgi:glycosyltransferase involved in cell wall biosynthesis